MAGRHHLQLLGEQGPLTAQVGTRLRHEADPTARPVVGDWVAIRSHPDAIVAEYVLPRRTQIVRLAAGHRGRPQVLCANVDRVFVVTSVGRDINPRRIERYLTAIWDGGAEPVIVINKADLADRLADSVRAVEKAAMQMPVVAVTAKRDDGLQALMPYLQPSCTIALVGSSGVGKSTIINRLLGAHRQPTGAVQAATTRRELIVAPGGWMLIDTPGIRERGLWHPEEDLEAGFPDVEWYLDQCRVGDCSHGNEPGCALHEAVARGELVRERVESYLQLQQELEQTGMPSRRGWQRGASQSLRTRSRLHKKIGWKI